MSRRLKLNRNAPCPCNTGLKFKNCCAGKVDWEAIINEGGDFRPYLSVRGRNLYFVDRISEILQLDAPAKIGALKHYKEAFTADAVRKIHEALAYVWPPDIDIVKALSRPSGDVSGLYIGDYGLPYLTRAIVRHSIYANKILLVDPFVYPRSVRDAYNPIINPEQYRAQTLKNVNFWLELLPWIEAGVVELIRPPADFDHDLNWEFLNIQTKKFEESEELRKAEKESVDELGTRQKKEFLRQQFWLGAPDEYLRREFPKFGLGKNVGVEEFLAWIHKQREEDPNFLEPLRPKSEAQLLTVSSGASYPSAVMTAGITGS
jgi:hypothetical protein